jgi:EKC/KEOPS complex subunit CGI121/TPRKB
MIWLPTPFRLLKPISRSFRSKYSVKISESFRRFGITPTATSLLVIKISTPDKPITASVVQDNLDASVKGTQVAFEDSVLDGMTNWANVRKYYKLGAGRAKGGATVNGIWPEIGEEEKRELEVQVLGAMALRGAS